MSKISGGEQMQFSYDSLTTNDKLILNLRDMGYMLRHMREGRGGQRCVLFVLNELGCITQSTLTEILGIQPGSASEVIGKLEYAGFLSRTQNPNDHRTMLVRLTKVGKQRVEEILQERSQAQNQMFSVLSEKEQEMLLMLLEKVCLDWTEKYPTQRRKSGRSMHHKSPHRHHRGK